MSVELIRSFLFKVIKGSFISQSNPCILTTSNIFLPWFVIPLEISTPILLKERICYLVSNIESVAIGYLNINEE